MANLNHPYIVRYSKSWLRIEDRDDKCCDFYGYYDFSFSDRQRKERLSNLPRLYAYIQMELCKYDLEKFLFEVRKLKSLYDFSTELRMIENLLEAVRYIHKDKKLMHRDIKTSNIFVVEESSIFIAKIGDFGVAKKVPELSLENDPNVHTSYMGTKIFAAPELQYKQYTELCDIYSLGIVFKLLLNKYKTMEEFVHKQNSSDFSISEDILFMNKIVYRDLETYIRLMTEKNYYLRPKDYGKDYLIPRIRAVLKCKMNETVIKKTALSYNPSPPLPEAPSLYQILQLVVPHFSFDKIGKKNFFLDIKNGRKIYTFDSSMVKQ